MNLANQITLVRIAMIPVFMVLYHYGFTFAALLVFLVAALTDFLDGYIARKRNQITDMGKFLDPLADKMLISAAFVYLTYSDLLPPWVTILVLFREFAVSGLRMVLAGEVVISASFFGKFKTTVQIISVAWLMLALPGGAIVYWGMLIITLASGLDYFYRAWPDLRKEV
jgi:CDP-diacylglycerol--glycerol-3-phosphate 3-phosphatidyltransferase